MDTADIKAIETIILQKLGPRKAASFHAALSRGEWPAEANDLLLGSWSSSESDLFRQLCCDYLPRRIRNANGEKLRKALTENTIRERGRSNLLLLRT